MRNEFDANQAMQVRYVTREVPAQTSGFDLAMCVTIGLVLGYAIGMLLR